MSLPGVPEGAGDREIPGVAVGIVTDNEDPEGMGRVKLTFPWRSVEDESYWARIATPMAGDDMGTYFLPEVDDEVLVAFEDGDIHHPYVLGALWNGKQSPPEENSDGKNDVREIKSRSGHEVILDDNKQSGKVEITSNAGHTITLDDSSGSEKITVEDKSGQNSIEFDAVGGKLDLKAGTKLTLQAPQLELKGDGTVKIQAGGMLTLKGAMIQLN